MTVMYDGKYKDILTKQAQASFYELHDAMSRFDAIPKSNRTEGQQIFRDVFRATLNGAEVEDRDPPGLSPEAQTYEAK